MLRVLPLLLLLLLLVMRIFVATRESRPRVCARVTAPARVAKDAGRLADDILAELLGTIGGDQGPIIVGGIGDSGTRGMREVLMNLGAQMLPEAYVHHDSKDSWLFMSSYVTRKSDGTEVWRSARDLYQRALKRSHTLKYDGAVLVNETSDSSYDWWHGGRQFVGLMVSKTMSVLKPGSGDPWGFKHPRTGLLLPFWLHSLGSKFKFIHVLRDCKDVIENRNDRLFREQCEHYYGRPCPPTMRQRVEFWADMNREMFEYAAESRMLGSQYLAVRIEDLVAGNRACFERVARFVGVGEDQVARAMEANKGHEASYFGNKWPEALRTEVGQAMRKFDKGVDQLRFWGYKVKEYGLALECDDLAWLSLLRQAKGGSPLPGDL